MDPIGIKPYGFMGYPRAYFHHFGTMTHTPGIGNFSAQTPKIGNFLVSLVKLSNNEIHHIYLNLAVLLSYNQNCLMYLYVTVQC